jgi:hypothetical protein
MKPILSHISYEANKNTTFSPRSKIGTINDSFSRNKEKFQKVETS